MQPISVHDNRVLSYRVDTDERRIVIQTRFEDREPFERTDIVFDGVVAYHFEGDNFQTIIFDVTEIDLPKLVELHLAVFEHGAKYGWPGTWNTSPDAALRFLQESKARGFTLDSSYGMSGWIVAANCRLERVANERPAEQPK